MLELTTGTLVDERFEVIEEVGRGGMGVVYRARHRQMDKIVALKVLQTALSGEPDKVARFQREARLISVLQHPNILDVYAIGVAASNLPYIAMEFLSGKQLSDLLAESGALPWTDVLPLMIEVCDALDYAHRNEIIHRDIKPSNIMLSEGRAKLVDFGIAKSVAAATPKLTQTNMLMGSVFYMSPSEFAGAPPGPSSDVYALGCTMFELLTAKRPYEGDTVFDTMTMHSEQPIPMVNTVNAAANIPVTLQELISAMMAKVAEDRPSALDAKIAMQDILAGRNPTVAITRVHTAVSPVARGAERRRLPKRVILFAAPLLAVAILGAVTVAQKLPKFSFGRQVYILADDPQEKNLLKSIPGAAQERRPVLYEQLGDLYLGKHHPNAALACYREVMNYKIPNKQYAIIELKIGYAQLARGAFSLAHDDFYQSTSVNNSLGERSLAQSCGHLTTDFYQLDDQQALNRLAHTEDKFRGLAFAKQTDAAAFLSSLRMLTTIRMKLGQWEDAAETLTFAKNYAAANHLDDPSLSALELVLRDHNGGVISKSDIATVQKMKSSPIASTPLVDVILSWALMRRHREEATALLSKSIQTILAGYANDPVAKLEAVNWTLAYVDAAAPRTPGVFTHSHLSMMRRNLETAQAQLIKQIAAMDPVVPVPVETR